MLIRFSCTYRDISQRRLRSSCRTNWIYSIPRFLPLHHLHSNLSDLLLLRFSSEISSVKVFPEEVWGTLQDHLPLSFRGIDARTRLVSELEQLPLLIWNKNVPIRATGRCSLHVVPFFGA